MNKEIQDFSRQFIKDNLRLLPESTQINFKRMYSHYYVFDLEGNSHYKNKSEADLEKNINDVVDDIPSDKLDWAMTQVKNSVLNLQDN